MSGFLKIEWSGFFDFPSGDYTTGDKVGFPFSGEFPIHRIKLEESGTADYEIDPGRPTYPTSSTFNFVLINKHIATGDQLYPFEDFINLGRTAEYGGKSDEFGDLFVKVSIPILGDKVIYIGMVEDFEYSQRDMDIKINCNDFIGSLKDLGAPILRSFNEGQLRIFNGTTDIQEIIDSFTLLNEPLIFDDINSAEDLEGNEVGLQRIWCNRTPFNIEGSEIPSTMSGSFSDKPWTEVESLRTIKELINHTLPEDSIFRRIFFDNFEEDIFIKTESFQADPEIVGDSATWWSVIARTEPRITFLQIGKHTILNPVIFIFGATIKIELGEPNDIPYEYRGYFRISSIHMNNDNRNTAIDGEDLIVFERGRYLKDTNNPNEADYPIFSEDNEYDEVMIHDYGFYPNDSGFIAKQDFVEHSEGITTSLENSINFGVLAGIFFRRKLGDETTITPIINTGGLGDRNEGYFNNVESLIENLDGNLIGAFVSSPGAIKMFDDARIVDSNYSHAFIADAKHYGWIETPFNEVIVNTARQINAYLYATEEGKIRYQRRNYPSLVDITEGNGFYELESEDYEILSGKKYGHGSKFYRISFGDIIEVNNLESQQKVDRVVGKSGIVDFFTSPRNLEISNYRTSDIGIPDSLTLQKADNNEDPVDWIVLRRPLGFDTNTPPTEWFIQLPVQQAVSFIESYPFMTEAFEIALDPLKRPDMNYHEVGIGDYFWESVDGGKKIYLVKKISYDPHAIYNKSTSIRMGLHLIGIVED